MHQITLKDNQYAGHYLSDCLIHTEDNLIDSDYAGIISDLEYIEHKNIKELLKQDNKNLFIMVNEDKIEDEHVFQLANVENRNCVIQTGNIVGFIGYGNTQITISSRFAGSEDDCFLHYMLSKVFNINLSELEHEEKKSNIFDFLIFIFPYYLRRAFSKGIFRQYKNNEYNDSNIKGPVNVARFIKTDIPFSGNVAYSKREYTVDNNLTELVRHTIEYINAGRYKNILKNSDTSQYVKEITAATPCYSKNQRELIISKNMKPVRHPYYSEWTDLQKICLMILRHQKLKYSNNENHKIFGILIDVSWLWEEYLHTILSKASLQGYVHPRNKAKKDSVYVFTTDNRSRFYPDFYCDDFIFDAKYKRFENHNHIADIGNSDLHQMISYIHIMSQTGKKPKNGYFLYPTENKDKLLQPCEIKGLGGYVGAFGLHISNANEFKTFAEDMRQNEQNFRNNFTRCEQCF